MARLIKLPQTWAVIAARTMTDPVWFFITDWFAIYLVTKGINPEQHSSHSGSHLLLPILATFLVAECRAG
jgi:hypothetical protein